MFIAIWFFRQVFLWTRRFLSQVFCCHTQSCELQKFTKHTIKRSLFFHKLTNKSISQHQGAILRSTAKKAYWKERKETELLPRTFAKATHFSRCKPHMADTLTHRKSLSWPHIWWLWQAGACEEDALSTSTRDFDACCGHQHWDLGILTRKWWIQADKSHQVGKKPSAAWSHLHQDTTAQPVKLTGKADGKHLGFSSQKWDHGENLNADRINQCFQFTEDLESIQGKEREVSSFHAFQPA